MKRHKRLWPRICSLENLFLAARRARRGKGKRPATAAFELEREEQLIGLRDELVSQSWQPGRYRQFTIRDPVPRLISAAPYRDRVVHHALCNVIEPLLDRGLIDHTYACRRGKGTHRAAETAVRLARRYRYVLKADVRKFFPSIDHEVLMAYMRRKIACKGTLWLVGKILESSPPQEPLEEYFPGDELFAAHRRRGIPIGNLTSQFFANLYLDAFDHWVKEDLRVHGYLRYVDDFLIFGDDRRELREVLRLCGQRLSLLRLRLHPGKCHVIPTRSGVGFVGYRIFPWGKRLPASSIRRFTSRTRDQGRAFREGALPAERLTESVQAWVAHASHARTESLRRDLFRHIVFCRGQPA